MLGVSLGMSRLKFFILIAKECLIGTLGEGGSPVAAATHNAPANSYVLKSLTRVSRWKSFIRTRRWEDTSTKASK